MSEDNSNSDSVVNRSIVDELRDAFVDYSMSVIVQRALPDVRDGLKPVHRRILYAMHEAGLVPGRPHKKCATVVGDVLGKYHPHGDTAVYDSLVRMAQDFSLRYPLIDGQGNFGSMDGDPAAAYRYTEAKLSPIATLMLTDIDKETVDFKPNFDDRLQEPTVLPAKIPNLLINGSSGIAVGMATNIPPHNLREVVSACQHVLYNPDCTVDDLMRFVKGPDFPTGGIIYGLDGIKEAYNTGRGKILVRAKADIIEKENGKERIIISEIPYMVNKSRLVEQISNLVKEKRVEGIEDLRDESNREGIRIVVDLKRDVISRVVLNQLYKHTQLQTTFGVIMLTLVKGAPKVLNLKDILEKFIDYRHEIVLKRTEFQLRKSLERAHLLEGLKIAVDHIDEVIAIIRGSTDTEAAKQELRGRFSFSIRQADAILNMRLAKLTGLELEQLVAELEEVRTEITDLQSIISEKNRRTLIINDELNELVRLHGDERRTEIANYSGSFRLEDLIADEEMVITVSHGGYIKSLPINTYRSQARGGRGVSGMATKEEDWVEHLFVASMHDYLMFFTREGQCYWLKVHEVPQGSRTSRGRPIVNLLKVEPGEKIASLVPVRDFSPDRYLIFATRKGVIKKSPLSAYGNVRSLGINAINIMEEDELIDVQIASPGDQVVLATINGMAIRFKEKDVRRTGRVSGGVRGITLSENDAVVGLVVSEPESTNTLLVVTDKGMGKRTEIGAYRLQRRGGRGVTNMRMSEKSGSVVAIKGVAATDELVLITRQGVINRQTIDGIRVIGRNTQGVRLINMSKSDSVVDVAKVIPETPEAVDAAVAEATAEIEDIVSGVKNYPDYDDESEMGEEENELNDIVEELDEESNDLVEVI